MERIALIANRNNILPFLFESSRKNSFEIVHFRNKNEISLNNFDMVVDEIEIDFINHPQDAIACVKQAIEEFQLKGVFTLNEEAIPLVCEIAAQCGLPGNTPAAAKRCRNKLTMRETFLKHGLNVPKFLDVTNQNYTEIAQQLGTRFIIKPKGGFGSNGVCLVSNEKDFVEYMANVTAIIHSDLSYTSNELNGGFSGILAEEFIGGDEYVVESFSIDGKAYPLSIGYKGNSQGPFFEESIYISLGHHDSPVAIELMQQTHKAIEALGIQMGPSHTELRLQGDKAYILEVGARVGGSGVSHFIIEQSTGLDFLGLQMRQCVGDAMSASDLNHQIKKSVSNYIIPIGGHGCYSHLEGIDKVKAHEETYEVFELLKKGDQIKPYPLFTGFPGFIFSTHSSYDAALKFQNFLAENINTVFSE